MDGAVPSDAKLIATVLSGDVEAYASLIGRYRDACFRFAFRQLGNREDAEDALQEALVRAFRGLSTCRERDRFGAWLYTIVVNECRTRGSRRAKRERRFVADVGDEVADPATDGSDETVGDEIAYALAQLAPDQREAFLLKHVEELSYEEMAEITGVGVSALKMRVKRGCERLRDLLEGVVR